MALLAAGTEMSLAQSLGGLIIPLAILFVFMYFMIIRPQRKEQK